MPQIWGEGDDWLVASPRRRKARRQAVRRHDWQREVNRFNKGRASGNRQFRFRGSREDSGGSNADVFLRREAVRRETDSDWDGGYRTKARRDGRLRWRGVHDQPAAQGRNRGAAGRGDQVLAGRGRRSFKEVLGGAAGVISNVQLLKKVPLFGEGRRTTTVPVTSIDRVSMSLSILQIFRRTYRTSIYGKG